MRTLWARTVLGTLLGLSAVLTGLHATAATFDNDARADIAVWRPSTSTWYIRQSSDGAVKAERWGDPTDNVVAGDYDGDGKADIAVWRSSTSTWYVKRSSDGAVMAERWGDPTDSPVPGDYDGDGKTDIAVWRPSTGMWYVKRSSDGAVMAERWGDPTDKPVPGDYDGDGKTDVAVWRPSTATWYVKRSSDGAVAAERWGDATDFPLKDLYASSRGRRMGGAIQGIPLSLAGATSTFAGVSLIGSQDNTGTAARFFAPADVSTDNTSLYVADSSNNTIRKVVIATGAVTTLAGTAGAAGSADGTGPAARFRYPRALATDGANLYVADTNNHTIRKVVIATGQVTTLAGTAGAFGSADNTGTAARFYGPAGITTDGTSLYVADTNNHTIRKVVIATGQVTTLAGTAGAFGSADNTGTAARFFNPTGIERAGTSLYVADRSNHTIRKIVIATGQVTTLAGTAGSPGSADNTGTAARFYNPAGITTDGTSLFVADTNNHTIRKVVIATGAVTTPAGTAGSPGSADGTGPAASFNSPLGMASDGTSVYVADGDNHAIRRLVVSTGGVSTPAGPPGSRGSADGVGTAARFNDPSGLTTDGTNLYMTDMSNHTIRKVVIATRAVSTLAGTAGSGGFTDNTGAAARFNYPAGITTDGTRLYVADTNNHTIRKVVIATGEVSTLAGTAGAPGYADGTGAAAKFFYPLGVTTDGTNLYVADSYNHVIRKVVIATGEVSTPAGMPGSPGYADGTGAAAGFYEPSGITTDGTNLYVADRRNHTIRAVAISTGVVTTLAGTWSTYGYADGTGAGAEFVGPVGITTDGTNLYVADIDANTVRKVVISSAAVTTLAGTGGLAGSADAAVAAARFYSPIKLTVDGTRLYVSDKGNNTIRVIE